MLSLISRWLKPGRVSIVCIAVMLLTTGCAGASASHTRTSSRQVLATFSEFFIPTLHAEPADITQGPGETFWFTEELGNKIGRISAEGGNVTMIEFLIPRADSIPVGIIDGSNDTLWFTEIVYNRIGNVMIQGQESHLHADRNNPGARFFGHNRPLEALALYRFHRIRF